MDISRLDKETQNYIKELQHCIDVQAELIDAQQEIIDNLKFQINYYEDYMKRINDALDKKNKLIKEGKDWNEQFI